MINTQDKTNMTAKEYKLGNFPGNIGVRIFAFAAAFLELCAGAMATYLYRYENDFQTYVLALNNPGFIAFYLYGYAFIISARLRNLQMPINLAYFWVLALWVCRFVIPSFVSMPIGLVQTAVIFILLPLYAKDKKDFGFRK